MSDWSSDVCSSDLQKRRWRHPLYVLVGGMPEENLSTTCLHRVVRAMPGRVLSSGQIVESSGFGKDKVLRVLRRLSGKNLVRVQGSGRATRYIRA